MFGQIEPPTISGNDLLEPDTEQIKNNGDNEELSSKIDLNGHELIFLSDAGLLTQQQVIDIQRHIQAYGKLIDVRELQAIESISLNDIRRLLPYVSVNSSLSQDPKKISQSISVTTVFRSKSEEENQESLLVRYRGGAGGVSWGITAENDAGEKFRMSETALFDYQSGFIEVNFAAKKLKIIAGDYLVSAGQGLAVWNSFARPVSSDLLSLKRISEGIRPHKGRNENNFFRGIASELTPFKGLKLMSFVSYHKIDASSSRSSEEEKFIVAFPVSGYHRTESELASRKSVFTATGGTSVVYSFRRLKTGLNAVHTHLQYPVEPSGELHSVKNFEGRNTTIVSADYNLTFLNADIFGEAAITEKKEKGFTTGALISAGQNLGIGLLVFSYSPGFHSIYLNAPFVSTRGKNKKGVIITTDLKVLGRLTIQSSCMQINSMLPEYTLNTPSERTDFRVNGLYTITKTTVLRVMTLYRSSKEKKSNDALIKASGTAITSSLGMGLSNSITANTMLSLTTVARQRTFEKQTTDGFLYSIAVKRTVSKKLSFAMGISSYETESDLPLVISEASIPGTIPFSTVYGDGERFYLACSLKMKYRIKLQARMNLVKEVSASMGHTVGVHFSKTM